MKIITWILITVKYSGAFSLARLFFRKTEEMGVTMHKNLFFRSRFSYENSSTALIKCRNVAGSDASPAVTISANESPRTQVVTLDKPVQHLFSADTLVVRWLRFVAQSLKSLNNWSHRKRASAGFISCSCNLFACFERGCDCWCWLCEPVSSQ